MTRYLVSGLFWVVLIGFCVQAHSDELASHRNAVDQQVETSVSIYLLQIHRRGDISDARRHLQNDISKQDGLKAYKSIVQTSPTLLADKVVLSEILDEMIRSGAARDPEAKAFLRKYADDPSFGTGVREAATGEHFGSIASDAKLAAQNLGDTVPITERTHAMLSIADNPQAIRDNLMQVRQLALAGGEAQVARTSAFNALALVNDWPYLLGAVETTDNFGRGRIVHGLAQYICANNYRRVFTERATEEQVYKLLCTAALESGNPVIQSDAVRALPAFLTDDPNFDLSKLSLLTPDKLNTNTVRVLQRVAAESPNADPKRMAEQLLKKLPR